MMRLLFVSSGLDPATGGTASAAVMIARAAARAGHAVTLVHPVAEARRAAIAQALAALTAEGVAALDFPFARPPGRLGAKAIDYAVAPALGAWLRREIGGFDAVVAHSAWVWTSVAAARAQRRGRPPLALMPHESLTGFDLGRGAFARLKPALRRWWLARCDRVILSSELERTESGLADDPRAVVAAHPAFDAAEPPPPRPPRAGPPRAGFLGRFHPKKNLALLVRALAQAPEWRLEIAGGGPPEAEGEIRALVAALGLTERVRLLGFLGEAERQAFLARIDLLAVPSAFECFGMVAAEALAAGTPALVAPRVGIAGFLPDSPVLTVVPPQPDALAAALDRFAARGRDDGLAALCRAEATRRFALEAHGARLTEILAEMTRG